jgi:hypothetical protein
MILSIYRLGILPAINKGAFILLLSITRKRIFLETSKFSPKHLVETGIIATFAPDF